MEGLAPWRAWFPGWTGSLEGRAPWRAWFPGWSGSLESLAPWRAWFPGGPRSSEGEESIGDKHYIHKFTGSNSATSYLTPSSDILYPVL